LLQSEKNCCDIASSLDFIADRLLQGCPGKQNESKTKAKANSEKQNESKKQFFH
jgi:hypothetical protein